MKTKKSNLLFIFLIITLGINQVTWSQGLIKSIPIEGKNVTNLSGPVNDSISFHIIINKISETYNSKVYFFDKNNEINNIEIYNEVDKPYYLAFHVNDSTLTIVRESTNKKIIIQDINYLNGKTSSSKIPFETNKIFSHKNITLIIGQELNNVYPLILIKKRLETTIKFITPKNEFQTSFFNSLSEKSEFVNDKQFLNNGPILKYKGFYNGEDLIFINDDKKNGQINILTINSSGELFNQNIPVRSKNGIKRLSSFVKDTLLFTFKMYNEISYLDIYRLNSLKKLKMLPYNKSNFGLHNKIVMRGKDVTKSFNPKKMYKDFTPQAIGSMYVPALNIAVNKTISNQYVIKIGHLDKNSYNNKSTKNFWYNNEEYRLNYDLKSGAIMAGQMILFKALAEAKNTGNYFELNLNKSLKKIDSIKTYEYYDIDENIYDDRLNRMITLNKHFYIIQKDYVRLINFDKKQKTYNIYNLSIINN